MKPNFDKSPDKLIPAVIQDYATSKVLMLGYMNEEAFKKTQAEKRVTFYSRSKQRLWTKGETSENYLNVVEGHLDCDADTLLFKVRPEGPACHTGADTCFMEENKSRTMFLDHLRAVIKERKTQSPEKSYTSSLFHKGINKVAQKVGEEAVEVVIEAKDDNAELFLNESADLLFHYLVLLEAKNFELDDVMKVLEERHQ